MLASVLLNKITHVCIITAKCREPIRILQMAEWQGPRDAIDRKLRNRVPWKMIHSQEFAFVDDWFRLQGKMVVGWYFVTRGILFHRIQGLNELRRPDECGSWWDDVNEISNEKSGRGYTPRGIHGELKGRSSRFAGLMKGLTEGLIQQYQNCHLWMICKILTVALFDSDRTPLAMVSHSSADFFDSVSVKPFSFH